MPSVTFCDAARVNRAVTASAERRLLLWLAARMPARVGSDHLTALALAAMMAAGASYWAAGHVHPGALVLVVLALAINWFGDSLDGTLARVRNQQRPRYGYYVDHVIDCIGAAFLFGGLATSGFMHPLIALGVLAAYLLVSAEMYLATHVLAEFRMSRFGMGPTELRILLAVGTLWLGVDPDVSIMGGTYRLFDVGGAIAIAGLLLALGMSTARNTAALYRAEPLRPRSRR